MNMMTQNKSESGHLTATRLKLAGVAVAIAALTVSSQAQSGQREPVLPSPLCDSVQVPQDTIMAFHAYALGVQTYRWNGTAWAFVAPTAVLYADAGFHGQIGTHSAGPTWTSNSGSRVVATRVAGCSPDPNSIAWLKLAAVSSDGPGIFEGVTFVQRVNTLGGLAPSSPGTSVGDLVDIPYMAEYLFFRDQN